MKKLLSIIISVLLVVSLAFSGCTKSKEKVNIISDYNVENADYKLDIDAKNEIKDISDLLYGIFFEDINFSADGGLYAEMVANRSFEFNKYAKDDEMYAWSGVGGITTEVKVNDLTGGLNENNKNYLVLTNNSKNISGVQNKGFLEGMAIKQENYKFSLYAKALDGYNGGITVKLVANDEVIDEQEIEGISNEWEKYSLTLKSNTVSSENVYLQVLIDSGTVAIDMVSLFPENTYKNRENGLRNDIATMLEELQPKFLRFPGGCVIEGYDEESAYDWKASVGATVDGLPLEFNGTYGDVAARRQGINIWTDINATDDEYPSFMTYGLGFYEYFQLAEDIGAIGVPVINCGMYCQPRGGKSVDINSDKFNKYLDDMLDLVEFCRGDEGTTWGKVRASLGHKEPFELKYICIGNENWGKDYYERYDRFVDVFNKEKSENPALYNGIELIYSSGTDDSQGSEEYINSYKHASTKLSDKENSFAGAIDQHYYNGADWFFKNADYYDEESYSRTAKDMTKSNGGKINVFLGEYASWSNKMYSALSEAAYMTGLERNGDIVAMSTYAPLLSSTTARHWAPDLIWFNNQSAMGSINYYMQMLFSQNQGKKLLESSLDGAYIGDRDLQGRIGIGTWATSAKFDNVKITDNKTGEILAEDDFSSNSIKKWEIYKDGSFEVKDGEMLQSSIDAPTTDFGSIMYYGEKDWSSYTYTVDATKLDGEEGFFIPFLANDNSIYFWNIGGYGNTVSCLQKFNYGFKTGQIEGTVKDFVVEASKTYKLKVVADGTKIKCYIDDELYIDYDAGSKAEAEAYQVVSTDETGDIIIKLVNVTGESRDFAINIENAGEVFKDAVTYQVAADNITDENIFGEKKQTEMEHFVLTDISSQFNYTAPKYSATVIRVQHK